MPNTTPLDIPSLLRRIPLFSELSEEDIQLVTRYTRERQVARGEVLFQRGDQYGHAKARFVRHVDLPRRKVDARRCHAGHGL